MKKVNVLLLVMFLLLLPLLSAGAEAPELQGQGNIKLKVHIHYPRPDRDNGKPAPQPAVCDRTTNDAMITFGLTSWKQSGPYEYHVNYGSIPSSVGRANAQAAIKRSFATWQGQANGRVSFSEGAETRLKSYKLDGLHVIVWGSTPSGAIAVTYTWYNSLTNEVVDQDIVMSARLPWAYNNISDPDGNCGNLYAFDVQNILTHEIGHVMGLDDLYNVADHDLTMYGYGDRGELKKDTLGAGDVAGMDALY